MFRSPMTSTPAAATSWLTRCGFAAFLFFLFKGLAWLLVPVLIAWASSAP